MTKMVKIWSFEHNAWWAPASRGYTTAEANAGLYDRTEAEEIVRQANQFGQRHEEIREVARQEQCPTCGHRVKSVFDHIAIDCEHDMTSDEIKELLAAESNG